MQRSWAEIYLHFVWATKDRMPPLNEAIERAVYRCICEQVQQIGCTVLAIGGIEDHVHLVLRVPTTASPSRIMQMAKGVSSHMVRSARSEWDGFDRQDHYSVFSVSRSHADRVIAYVKNQKRHHAGGNVWEQWEQTGTTVP